MKLNVHSRTRTALLYLLAPLLTAGTTIILLGIQSLTGNEFAASANHLFVTGYVLPIVIMAYLGGRYLGLSTLLYTTPCSVYFLMAPRFSWKFDHPWQWGEVIFEDLAGIILIFGIDALRRNEILLREAQQRADREALMNRIAQALRSSSDPDLIIGAAMRALGEALVADRCYFALVEEDDDRVGIQHDWRRPGLESLAGSYKLAEFESGLAEVFHAGQTVAVRDIRERPFSNRVIARMVERGHVSGISVPINDKGKFVAALVVAMAHQPRDWTPDEISLVEVVSAQVRTAVEHTRLRLREHNIATALQEALQPDQPPQVAGLELAMHYRAALAEASVGGDFCDVFSLDKGVTCIVIGDLSGKGLAAAAQIATLRNMLRYSVYRNSDLATAVNELNNTLIDHNLLSGFATLFVGVFDNGASTLTYVSCGHEPALLKRHATGMIEEFTATGPAIGIISGPVYSAQVVPLTMSDTMLIYTDGVTEAGNDHGDFLGVTGLAHVFREQPEKHSTTTIIEHIVQRINEHAGGHLRDDVCMMLVRVDPGITAGYAVRQRLTLSKGQGRSDKSQASFYREVLQAATGGRLTLCETEELHTMVVGEPTITCELESYADVSELRQVLSTHLASSRLSHLRGDDVSICVTEAAANAVKHGGPARAEIWLSGDEISVLISDSGPGISSTDLARATLESGFSTAESLGMGFTMMMESADSITMSTSDQGTKVMLRIGANPRLSLADKLLGGRPEGNDDLPSNWRTSPEARN